MQRGKKRVVVDTNCWISFLIGHRLSRLVEMLSNQQIQLVICEELLEEITDVASRPKFKKYFAPAQVSSLLSFLTMIAESHEIKETVPVCRDACDDYLVSLAMEADADFLLTGDEDLLVLEKIGKCRIVDAATFEACIKQYN